MSSSGYMTSSSNTQSFFYKLRNLLVILNLPETKYKNRTTIKDTSDIDKFIGFKGSGSLKGLRIYQAFIKSLCEILPRIAL